MAASRYHAVSPRRSRANRRHGVALLVVLWVLVLLTLITLSHAGEMRSELRLAVRGAEELQARTLAESAVELAIAALREDDVVGDDLAASWRDDETRFRSIAMEGGRVWVWFGEHDPGDGRELRWGVRDEASRLNVNVATRDQLLAIPGMDEELADAILDWRDGDAEPRELGAEVEFYALLDTPYLPKNGPFETLEELLAVAGFDAAVLWGEDRNRNGILDPREDDGDRSFPPDDSDGELQRGLADFLTVISYEPNLSDTLEARLDINEASQQELRTRLEEKGLAPGLVDQVIELSEGPSEIASLGQLLQIQAVNEEALAILLSELKVDTEDELQGLINVNTAAAEILSGLPGLEPEDVDSIVSRRLETGESHDSSAWLLRVLSRQKLAPILDRITVRSFQHRVQAVALLDDHPVIHRLEMLVDRAWLPYRVVWRRDLTSLGFPLPNERGEDLP